MTLIYQFQSFQNEKSAINLNKCWTEDVEMTNYATWEQFLKQVGQSFIKGHNIFSSIHRESWKVTTGCRRKFERTSKKKSRSRRRSQAVITAARCTDRGDNTHSGANRKPAQWTSAHPVFLYLRVQSSRAEVLDFSKGLPRGQAKVTSGRSWGVQPCNHRVSSNGEAD